MSRFDYGTSKFSLGRAIRGARVNRIRAATLEGWGAAVMDLEDELRRTKASLNQAERLLGLAGRIDGWGEEVEQFLTDKERQDDKNRSDSRNQSAQPAGLLGHSARHRGCDR